MKTFFILDYVMNSKLRMRNLVFYRDCAGDSSVMGCYVVYCLILEIQVLWVLCCVLFDPGDSSIMGCYVVYCLILVIKV
jgi:hypothetical protein